MATLRRSLAFPPGSWPAAFPHVEPWLPHDLLADNALRYAAYLTAAIFAQMHGEANGQLLRFRLRANPTVTRAGKRHGLTSQGAQLAWLQRQGERGGFQLVSCGVSVVWAGEGQERFYAAGIHRP